MTNIELGELIGLAAAWVGYGVIHSLLASITVRDRIVRRWPSIRNRYRLIYNLLAIVLLAPPLWWMYGIDGTSLWRWHGVWGWIADALALAAIAGFLWSLRYYDNLDFLGLRGTDQAHAELRLSPLHRRVRHPWYFLSLIILWTRDMNVAFVVAAVVLTIYLAVGIRFEEAKLVRQFGDAYRQYQKLVPALFPRPGRSISAQQAAHLEALADRRDE